MTESSISPNAIDLPCDTEPLDAGNGANRVRGQRQAGVQDQPTGASPVTDPHLATRCPECGNGTICSPALCNRRRELHARLRESVRMLDGASNVVELAAVRAERRGRR